ncbi:pirin family protein [Solimonas marina]|uniref:Pirin family protein n=1 Tax=Solimonas marina TaxID=2714601 RepID=A0A969W8E4_9GAMM|nr:pirin family protein [Solimonas marina]NKF22302.1 pirin family protein [Solimonas marina]
MSTVRPLRHVIPSVATSDGAGVKLRRSIGSQRGLYLDPFLMLDEFYSDNPDDYLAGFPSHPHRGFETVTYMLDGHLQHRDHLGNTGDLQPGSVQWMTAARGIIHSEMPQQTEGRMRGFQLWINLPAAEKMKPASYRDIPATDVPAVDLGGGVEVHVIAGTLEAGDQHVDGPVSPAAAPLTTEPLYLDVRLAPGASFRQPLADTRTAFVYVYDGEAKIAGKPLPNRAAGALDAGDTVQIDAGPQGARVLLLAARPLREPIVQYGPFVMNTREEIEQAIFDYQSGTFGKAA